MTCERKPKQKATGTQTDVNSYTEDKSKERRIAFKNGPRPSLDAETQTIDIVGTVRAEPSHDPAPPEDTTLGNTLLKAVDGLNGHLVRIDELLAAQQAQIAVLQRDQWRGPRAAKAAGPSKDEQLGRGTILGPKVQQIVTGNEEHGNAWVNVVRRSKSRQSEKQENIMVHEQYIEQTETPVGNNSRRTPRAPKNQAVILNHPSGSASYASMVREVKAVVREGNLTYDITTRRAKSGNIILEIPGKEQADHLAEVLKTRIGETVGIRRPSPSIPLILLGIEDSVDESELKGALVTFDGDLKDASDFIIREGRNGTKTAVIRVLLKAGTKLIYAKRIKVGWAYCRIKEFDVRK